MNEIEAKEEAKRRIKQRENIFCPLTKMICRKDCESWVYPEIHNLDLQSGNTDAYYVQHGFCTASCLHTQE